MCCTFVVTLFSFCSVLCVFVVFYIMNKMKTSWLLLSFVLTWSEASKILVVFPIPIMSHKILGDGIVRHLLKAGHEVTYVTPYPYYDVNSNLRLLDVSSNRNFMSKNLVNLKRFMDQSADEMNVANIIQIMTAMAKNVIINEDFQKILNDPKEQFDAVIAEWVFTEVTAGLASVFDCPLIWFLTFEANWMILRLIDEPSSPAYTEDTFSHNTSPLNFLQRANELWTQIKVQFMNYIWLDGMQERVYQSVLAPIMEKRGKKLPTFDEARFNASILLSNAYVSTCQAISLPQSHKYIGGFHIDDDVKPLPENLKKVMDKAKDGVIYFSMGSNLKGKDMPEELKVSLLKMFGTLKQTVLWKFEEVLPNLPANVHILEWAPQHAILSHPNLVVFITHGGLLSTTEAIHFGVPIIGIPVFGDQPTNIAKAINRGIGVMVDLSYTMANELKKAIIEVTTNTRYSEKAKELSFIHHDRPVKPGQELVHWVNHVINTRGAPHLRSPAVDLPFYKRKFLDLAALIVVIFLALRISWKRACAYVCSKRRTGREKKDN